MHVGLNLIYLMPGETGGMEVVARELLPALVAGAPEVRFTSFINREAAAAGGGPWHELTETVTVPVRASNGVEWVRGEQQHLPRLASRAGVDLVHSLGSTAPLWGAFRRVVTVHDLIYLHFPETHGRVRALGLRALVPAGVRRAHRVLTDSQSTRRDLIACLGTPGEKIDVVPLGLGAGARDRPPPETETRARLGVDRRQVLLSLSAKRPHKNIGALIAALALIPAERRPVLVVPGYRTPHEAELRQVAERLGVGDDVRFPGWVSGAELEGLYGVAACAAFPSLYEGFGLPVLEAMARGVPVVCSDRSSLPEVAGDAALLVDPTDPGQIAVALEGVLGDPSQAERLQAAGRERARHFTWEATARATLASYRRAGVRP